MMIIKKGFLFLFFCSFQSNLAAGASGECVDTAQQGTQQCRIWAASGECDTNSQFMHEHCQKSCGICGEPIDIPECSDLAEGGDRQCREWAWHGECEKNPEFMHMQCRKSCGLCTSTVLQPSKCEDEYPKCSEWADDGLCIGDWQAKRGEFLVDSSFVVQFCPKSCQVCDIFLDDRDLKLKVGIPQTAPDITSNKSVYNKVRSQVAETRRYIQSLHPSLQNACRMAHPNCARFALSSDCEDNEDHDIMKYMCAASCQTCERFIDEEDRKKAEEVWIMALMEYKNKNEAKET